MGNYSKGVYWKQEQEELCKQWLSATTEIEYTRIYNALVSSVNKVAEIVLNRYFSVPVWQQQLEIRNDAVQHFFLKLKDFKPETGTAYSYVGLICKHFYLDNLVINKEKYTRMHNQTEYIDDYDEHSTPIQYEQSEPIDYDRVIKFLKAKKLILAKKDKALRKAKRGYKPVIFQREMAYIDVIIEYIEKFQDITPASIADYVVYNCEKNDIIKIGTVYYLRKIMGIETKRSKKNKNNPTLNFESTGKGKKVDKYNYLLDDTPPNESKFRRRNNMDSLRKKYPDIDMYSYF